MHSHIANYFLPVIPLVTRFLLCLRWNSQMSTELSEAAQERDVQRTFILSLAGFSFTAIAGLALLDGIIRVGLQLPTWYVLLSFIAFFASLNAQSYKSNRLHNQIATALVEIGTLSLMLSLVALLFTAPFNCEFQWIATFVTLGTWLMDHLFRISIDYSYLAARARVVPHP